MIRLTGDPHGWDAEPTAVAIGMFDGVHLGHRAVLGAATGRPGAVPAVLTFTDHPARLLDPARVPPLLTTRDQRLRLIAETGIRIAAVVDFDESVRRLSPEVFIERYLVTWMRAAHVAVGTGFRFGYRAAGDVDTLREEGRRFGFTVDEVPPVSEAGREVRSSAIRESLADGDVESARRMLGRPHRVSGVVVPGAGRGRSIGILTANVAVDDGLAVPARGVYAVRMALDGEELGGVANLGVRPTFGGGPPTLEVHLFDVDRDLYGVEVEVAFLARIRDEQRFDSVAELVECINQDIAAGRGIVARTS